jgi:hypothetical protein
MVTVRSRIIQFGFILGLLAVLVSGTSIDPQQATARPVATGGSSGDPYGTGDPTGDDLPSPTPKPTKSLSAARVIVPSSQSTAMRGTYHSPVRWNVYLSILIRLGLR